MPPGDYSWRWLSAAQPIRRQLLGALSGLMLVSTAPRQLLVLGIGLIGTLILWQAALRTSPVYSQLVAVMGIAFISTAVLQKDHSLIEVL